MPNRLFRSRKDRIVFGVCGGLGQYFDIDPVLVRLVFVAVTLEGGAGVLAYLILAIVLPVEDSASAGGRAAIHENLEQLKDDAEALGADLQAGLGGRDRTGAVDGANARRGRRLAGVLLLVLGLVLLAASLDWLSSWMWRLFWPLLLMGLGAALLLRSDAT